MPVDTSVLIRVICCMAATASALQRDGNAIRLRMAGFAAITAMGSVVAYFWHHRHTETPRHHHRPVSTGKVRGVEIVSSQQTRCILRGKIGAGNVA